MFVEMKGLSGFRCFFMIFSNVPSAEEGGEFIVKTTEIEDLQVEPLSKIKKKYGREFEFGR